MNSTRLPGKTLMPLCGKPLLAWCVERAQKIDPAVDVVVLTGDVVENQLIVEWCTTQKVACFVGSEDDVLGRYTVAAHDMDAHTVIRLTADNPLIDFELARDLMHAHLDAGVDYSSSKEEFGSGYPAGIGVEIFERGLLDRLNAMDLSEEFREHVNEQILAHPADYRHFVMAGREDVSDVNFSLDTAADLERIERWIGDAKPGAANRPDFWREVDAAACV